MDPGQRVVVVTLEESQDSLAIGIGDRLCVLAFVKGDEMPPYYCSRGVLKEGDGLSFYMGGHWSEFSARTGISEQSALEAIRYFVEEGKLEPKIHWTED